ncbi:hypothetical protein NIIDNTM18_48460 [Mycolicibacterium litorale]|uniref:Uncharacterized protein n=2 Tax=Mycolicibacterium litorale TaxID=758802 RepID=A0A6S6PHZ0_9MYCO|nr:hypothetical protein NIIDNTM18_48460 [Mycolicibacterium litorale]
MGAHVCYELAAGMAMPLSSVAGPAPAAAVWVTGTACSHLAAGRRGHHSDRLFAVMNGLFLWATAAHFIYWPTRWTGGVPYLLECEGMRGRVVGPYNGILYVSAVAAALGLVENRRAGLLGAAVPLVVVPALLRIQRIEFRRLRAQAHRNPAWWNRRLQGR